MTGITEWVRSATRGVWWGPGCPPPASLRRLARHVAAQAVASTVTGAAAGGYQLDAHWPQPHGVVGYSAKPATPECDRWWSELVARLAGDQVDLAEAGNSHGDLTNILQAQTVAAWIATGPERPAGYPHGPIESGAVLAAARRQAVEILASHAVWVDSVAEALLSRGHLNGGDVTLLTSTGAAA